MKVLPDPRAASLRSDHFYEAFAQQLPVPPDVADILAMSPEEKDRFLASIAQWQHWPTRSCNGLSKDSLYFFSFDISRALDTQLTRAKEELRRLQAKYHPEIEQFKRRKENWPHHLRVIDAKDQGAKHRAIFAQFADEAFGDDDLALDAYYKKHDPKAKVSQWLKSAREAMVKASSLL